MTDTISKQECTEQVKRMARRTALLHYYFSKTMIDELGEVEGTRLILKAITAYGEHCGRKIRQTVEELGLPLTQENFDLVPDLPAYGWESDTVTMPDGEVRAIARYCPLADVLLELGEEGKKLGRLYCFVDQAKQQAYDPTYEFIHTKNLIDGDPYCEFLIREKKD